MDEFGWLNEFIEKMPTKNWLYKLICFFLGKKKLTFKEYYAILEKLNSEWGKDKSKKIALNQTLKIYYYQNNKLPDNIINERL